MQEKFIQHAQQILHTGTFCQSVIQNRVYCISLYPLSNKTTDAPHKKPHQQPATMLPIKMIGSACFDAQVKQPRHHRACPNAGCGQRNRHQHKEEPMAGSFSMRPPLLARRLCCHVPNRLSSLNLLLIHHSSTRLVSRIISGDRIIDPKTAVTKQAHGGSPMLMPTGIAPFNFNNRHSRKAENGQIMPKCNHLVYRLIFVSILNETALYLQ